MKTETENVFVNFEILAVPNLSDTKSVLRLKLSQP